MSINNFLPFTRPLISEDAIAAVGQCLREGWLSTGPRVLEFTHALQAYFNAPYVIPLMSATTGLHLALLAMGLEPHDEVITTPLTFAATANAIVLAGGTPVFVDIAPTTFNLDTDLLEQAITERTRVILPVHFAGLPANLDAIYALAARYQLRVLEDAAHAMGTQYNHQLIGSFGDTQVFSFHPNKNITTGEGGCVVTRDATLAEKILRLHFHGLDKHFLGQITPRPIEQDLILFPGYKSNMTDIQAILGSHQLQALEEFIARRTALAERYHAVLAHWPQCILPAIPSPQHRHAWHLYTVLINQAAPPDIDRDQFRTQMLTANIGTGLHYYPALHLHPYYRHTFGYQQGDFPHAEAISKRIVSLPLCPAMTDAEQARVLTTMQTILQPVTTPAPSLVTTYADQ